MKKKKISILLSVAISMVFVFGIGLTAHAANTPFAGNDDIAKNGDAGDIVNTVIGYLTALLAGLFVLMMIVGAIWYMVFPDPGKKQEGMKIIQAAIIAGVFALLSFAIWMILKEVLGVGSTTSE